SVWASRGMRDEKVTIFVRETPERDLMRAVARLFGDKWARTGEESAYRYELLQDLKSQLAEEEMRNGDLNAALLALDSEMARDRAFALPSTPALSGSQEQRVTDNQAAGQIFDQLKARVESAGGKEKARLQTLAEHGGWAGMQLYFQLSPAERVALRNGQRLQYG